MNVLDAAYWTVHDYPGGSVSLAPRLGMAAAVLRSKVNPRCATHRLALDEADAMIGLTGDLRMVQALAANHGQGLVALRQPDDDDVLGAVLAESSASGQLASILHAALADGVISAREMLEIDRAGLHVQGALVALLEHMRGAVRRPVRAA